MVPLAMTRSRTIPRRVELPLASVGFERALSIASTRARKGSLFSSVTAAPDEK